MPTNTQRIGRCGELLVQYKLLKLGVESAPMTTDAGIDLVCYTERLARAVTLQVKTNAAPKPGGGRGKLALDWWIADDCPAEVAAFVDLATDSVWLFSMEEVARVAQQHSRGRHHLYMYVDASAAPRGPKPARAVDFHIHRLEHAAPRLLGA